jgi:CheY-like chemotaxis protein
VAARAVDGLSSVGDRSKDGAVESEWVDFNLGTLLEAVIMRLALQAEAEGLQLGYVIQPEVSPTLSGDPDRLQNLLTSLVGIAMDATVHGEVGLCVRALGDGMLRFEVSGTPTGDDAGRWGPVFEALAPNASGQSRAQLRMGVCQRLAAAVGGEIAAEAGPDGRHTLWFGARVAAGPATPPDAATAAERPAEVGPSLRAQVLIADDSLVNQEVARRTLQRMGYDVDVVGDGEKAVAAVMGGSYSLVLMDCQMPGMDGYAATREIRQREGAGRHTPVVAMTASAMEADRERCLAAGMDAYVSKPFEYDDLEAVVDHWVRAHAEGTLAG